MSKVWKHILGNFYKIAVGLFTCCILTSCADSSEIINESEPVEEIPPIVQDIGLVRYLAIGDSYTVGEGLETSQSWPSQLKRKLLENGVEEVELTVIAATGYTTREVTQLVNTATFNKPFDIISIQVGVNNQYRGESVTQFGEELEDMFQTIASNYYLKDAKQVVVSIPDWGATPFGSSYDRVQIAIEINQFNGLKRNTAEAKAVPFINITDISRTNPDDPELVASDGLHPSELMYSYWVERIFPVVKEQLQI